LATIQDIAGSVGGKIGLVNGQVDVTALTPADLNGNEGAQLVYDLATSKNVYSYSEGTTINTAAGPRPTKDAIENLDKNPDSRKPNGKTPDNLPPSGVASVVVIDPATRFFNDTGKGVPGTLQVALRAIAFHELAEAYAKVDRGLQYLPIATGAHAEAISREQLLLQQRPSFTPYPAGGNLARK
jgi:hypothetical protein